MENTGLYRYLFGIQAGWAVEKVKLDLVNERGNVWAKHPEGLCWPCPDCRASMLLYDHLPQRGETFGQLPVFNVSAMGHVYPAWGAAAVFGVARREIVSRRLLRL